MPYQCLPVCVEELGLQIWPLFILCVGRGTKKHTGHSTLRAANIRGDFAYCEKVGGQKEITVSYSRTIASQATRMLKP